jgi:hypothetical protein
MDHQPEIAFQPECDAFADTAQGAYIPVAGCRKRRLQTAQQKRAGQAYALERLVDHERLQGTEISSNIRQFGHTITRS